MPKIRSHYDTLEVSEDASQEVIVGAYRYLSQKWHPDKNPGDAARAGARMKEINAAYEVLSVPATRAEYDQWLGRQRETAGHGEDASTSPHSSEPARADDDGLRYHYADAIASRGRFFYYLAGFVIVFIGLSIIIAVFDGLQPYLARHPVITLLIVVGASVSIGNEAIHMRRRDLLERHGTKVLEVMYTESMRKRLIANVIGGIAGVFLAAVFIIGYTRMDADRARGPDTGGAPPVATAMAPDSAGTSVPASGGAALPTRNVPVSATVPATAPAPLIEASEATELTFNNQCDAEIRLAILHLNEDAVWKVETWNVPASIGGPLYVDDKPMLANGQVFYVYAESTDGKHVWKGTADDSSDLSYLYEEVLRRFEHVRMPPGLPAYQLTFNCAVA